MKFRPLALLVPCLLCWNSAGLAQMSEEEPSMSLASEEEYLERTSSFSGTMMSPYCPGVTLSACASDSARKLRDDIYDWIEAGASDQQVKSRLEGLYGEDIWGAPQKSGFGLVGWWMPTIAFLGGMLVLMLVLRRMVRSDEEAVTEVDYQKEGLDPEMVRLIEKDLELRIGQHEREN